MLLKEFENTQWRLYKKVVLIHKDNFVRELYKQIYYTSNRFYIGQSVKIGFYHTTLLNKLKEF